MKNSKSKNKCPKCSDSLYYDNEGDLVCLNLFCKDFKIIMNELFDIKKDFSTQKTDEVCTQ